jgi:hypothetical protein
MSSLKNLYNVTVHSLPTFPITFPILRKLEILELSLEGEEKAEAFLHGDILGSYHLKGRAIRGDNF